MGLFVWYFGTSRQLRGRRASHHHDGPALPRAAARHLRAQGAGRGFQPLPASPDRDRSVPGAAGLRHVLRALAGAAISPAGIDWLREAEPYRRAIARHLAETVLPGLEERDRDLARAHARSTFATASARSAGAGFGLEPMLTAERLVPPAQPQRGRARASISSAPAPIPARAVPGVISSARVLDKVVPDASPSRLSRAIADAADLAACRAAARRLARRSTPPRCSCRRGCASRPRALRLLPPVPTMRSTTTAAARRDRAVCGSVSTASMRAARRRMPVDRAWPTSCSDYAIPRELPGGADRGLRLGRRRPALRRPRRAARLLPPASPARSAS